MLAGADLDGRALTVALATDFRNKVLLTPEFEDARKKGFAGALLLKTYHEFQKADLLPNAAGVAIWLHSERAENDLTLVPTARIMWQLLEESFSRVEEAVEGYYFLTGITVNAAAHDVIPPTFRMS